MTAATVTIGRNSCSLPSLDQELGLSFSFLQPLELGGGVSLGGKGLDIQNRLSSPCNIISGFPTCLATPASPPFAPKGGGKVCLPPGILFFLDFLNRRRKFCCIIVLNTKGHFYFWRQPQTVNHYALHMAVFNKCWFDLGQPAHGSFSCFVF